MQQTLCRSKLDNWGGGGAHIHIFVFTDHKNNRFQKKLITQNTNIWIWAPQLSSLLLHWANNRDSKIVMSNFKPSKSALTTLLTQEQVQLHTSDASVFPISVAASSVSLLSLLVATASGWARLAIFRSWHLISSLERPFNVNELLSEYYLTVTSFTSQVY